jgi:two-component system, OmpR family, sensor kinase
VKKPFAILGLVLLAFGFVALYLIPIVWQPEPVLVFRVGIGAGIFAILFALAVLIQFFIAAHDWGREKAVHEVTHERDESHRQFLQRLDHELKNPLTGLQAAITNLHEAQSTAETYAAVENASLATIRLGRILRDLRKLAELEAQMFEHRPLDAGQLVCEMVNAATGLPAYQGRSVNLLVSKVPTLPFITGDRDMLGLAFFNLLDNALKYSAPTDAVEVRVREDGRTLFIEVADGGAGIALQEQQRIFDDLYRGENACETEGSGLGLPLARRIVQLHGGEISLRSDPARGRGTVFTIRLPVS